MSELTQDILNEFVAGIGAAIENEANLLAELKEKERQAKENTRQTILSYIHGLRRYLVGNALMQSRVIAYLYWNVEALPVAWINQTFQISDCLSIARENQYHGLRCSKCGGLMTYTSRNDIQGERHKDNRECKTCWNAKFAERDNAYKQYMAQRQQRLSELHTMPYREYLLTDEWQQTRLRKLKRAHFSCELCGKQGKLNVHHKTYERRGYEDDKDLIVLCGTCHAKFHDKLPQDEA